MRNKIKEKLFEIDSKVYYGLVPDTEEVIKDDWNYFVFGQRKISKSGTSSTDLNGYWYVTIVRENFIPDNVVFDVIKKLTDDEEGISGLRLANTDFEYTYTFKGSTNIVVEILELQFTKTKKRCK